MSRSKHTRRIRKKPLGSLESSTAPVLEPNVTGTGIILFACLLATFFRGGEEESISSVLRMQGIIVGFALAASIAIDASASVRNAVRVDVVCLSALYFLTYVEFLFPQPGFDMMAQSFPIEKSSSMTLLGIAALSVGRHSDVFWSGRALRQESSAGSGLRVGHWLALMWISAALGYLHMLLAVNFNPLTMVLEMMEPRFSQPWGRGKFGDWKALVFELSLFLSLIPPVYGVLLAKRRKVPSLGFWMATGLTALTLFYGFSGGTRNVFATYIAGLIGAYLLVQPKLLFPKVAAAAAIGMILLYVSTQQMLAFRQIGLANYLKHGKPQFEEAEDSSGFFVDANLLNMAMVIQAFDLRHDPTGLDVPYNALVRPIPRAIWPGKPEGLKIGIEESVGMEGLTLAVTFVGEGYMSAKATGVILSGLFFGGLCGFWNARFRNDRGSFSQLVYAAGFLPAAISMRSLFSFTPAVLPIVGLLIISWWLKYQSGEKLPKKARAKSIRRRSSPAIHLMKDTASTSRSIKE